VLSAAADEVTRDLAPGSVEIRLRGRDPYFYFVVTSPDLPETARDSGDAPAASAAVTPVADSAGDGVTAAVDASSAGSADRSAAVTPHHSAFRAGRRSFLVPTFGTPEPITVDLAMGDGRVEIIASNRTDTVVRVDPGTRAGAAGRVRVGFARGTLEIRTGVSVGILGRADPVAVTFELPSRSSLLGACWPGPRRRTSTRPASWMNAACTAREVGSTSTGSMTCRCRLPTSRSRSAGSPDPPT
jgi:hypothetical protein